MGTIEEKSYIARLIQGMFRQTIGRIAIYSIALFVFVALAADFLANDRPILCSYQKQIYSPVINSYSNALGWSSEPKVFQDRDYRILRYGWAIWPPVRFKPDELHLDQAQALPPLSRFERGAHWLGTDDIGRDVLSGLIHGTRTALAIALLSMGIAFLIGVLFGIGAGYLGDRRWKVRPDVLICSILGSIVLIYSAVWLSSATLWMFLMIILIVGLYALARDRWLRGGSRHWSVPVDGTVLRIMEILRAIPDLFLLLAALAIMRNPGILQIALLIGLLRWPSIARYVRAEVLRIRNAPFIEVARTQEKSSWRIMWTYLLPNAIGPALIAVVFGMSSAVLIEAALSFLGIGLPASEVTWGGMMSEARNNLEAWWLALFPGLAIFLLIWTLNQAADALLDELQTERRHQTPYF